MNEVQIYSYKNTRSEAGSPELASVCPDDVLVAICWTNQYGNPTWVLHMANGDTHLMPDCYGALNYFPNAATRTVRRKKDLF